MHVVSKPVCCNRFDTLNYPGPFDMGVYQQHKGVSGRIGKKSFTVHVNANTSRSMLLHF